MADSFNDDYDWDAAQNEDQSNVELPEEEPKSRNPIKRMKESLGPGKFAAVCFILIGTLVLVITVLLFGKSDNSSKKNNATNNKPSNTVTPKPTQGVTQQNNQSTGTSTSKSDDWTELNPDGLTTGVEKEGTFVVREVKYYVRSLDGILANYQLKTEVIGGLTGYDGVYKLIVPYTIMFYDEKTTLSVTFKEGQVGDKVVIYDLVLAP